MKEFSRIPIDLALEQTINAMQLANGQALAHSQIFVLQDKDGHFLTMSIIPNLLETLDLNIKEDVSTDLQNHKIKKNAKTLKNILEEVEQVITPFSSEIDEEHLYDVGRAASKETSTFLLKVNDTGNDAREKLIMEVNENPSRFEESITRCKVSTFANEGVNFKKHKKSADKVVELKMERNLFGRLLCLALERKIDIVEILRYPLTLVPLSFRWDYIFNE